MLDDALTATIGDIYDAAIDPDAVPGVLTRLRHLTESEIGVFAFHDPFSIAREITEGLDPRWTPGTHAFWHQNLWFQRRHLVPPGRAVLGEALARREEWHGVELFEDYLRPAGCVHLLGVALISEPDFFAHLSLSRPEGREPHGHEELRITNALAGHLARAFRMAKYLEDARAHSTVLASALDRLTAGCLVIDSAARLIFANAAAEAILSRGRPLRVSHGRLAATGADDQAKWHALVGRLHQGGRPVGTAVSLESEPGAALRLLAVPLGRDRAASLGLLPRTSERLGLVVITTGERAPAPPEVLGQLFALTPSETALALALADGETLQAYVGRTERSLNTVKTHLKAVFAKTGTSRQADLVRLIASLSTLRAKA